MHAMILLLFFFIAYVVQPTLALAGEAIVECKNGAAAPIRPKISPYRCSDDPYSSCMAVFEPHTQDATNHILTNPFKVSPKCIDPAFKYLALKCASRCALCCKTAEFNCANDAHADCAAFEADSSLCNSKLVIEKARKECPATCGFCQMRSACNDTIAHCGFIKQFFNCDDVQMKQQCMGTCGLNDCLSPIPICKDEASDCHMVLAKGYCNRPDIIGANAIGRCKKTCGKC